MPGYLSTALEKTHAAPALLTVMLALWQAILAPAFAAAPQNLRIHAASGGRVRALIIGIDHYQHKALVPVLNGAVADARDLETTLRRLHADEITTLLEGEATRARVEAALQSLEQTTRPGDLVIFTFAGHGGIEDTRFPSLTPSGKDQLMLLWGFGDTGPATRERIIDRQIYLHLKALTDAGADVLFAADTCYGGGLSKAAAVDAVAKGVRGLIRVSRREDAVPGTYFIAPGEDQLELPPMPPGEDATADLPRLTFVAAVEPSTEAPEVRIEGIASRRGAASYALARGLEGAADQAGNRDGVTTRLELAAYVRATVRSLTDMQQNPVVKPVEGDAYQEPVFGLAPGGGGAASIALPRPVPGQSPAYAPALASVFAAPQPEPQPHLQWNAEGRRFEDQSTGKTYAYDTAQDQAEAVTLRASLGKQMVDVAREHRPLKLGFAPVTGIYRGGTPVDLMIAGATGRYLILLDLAGDGELAVMFPVGKSDRLLLKPLIDMPLKIAPPFGHDLLIGLALRGDNRELLTELNGMSERGGAQDLVRLLRRHLAADDAIGLFPYWSAPR